jgi:hypothetical protein
VATAFDVNHAFPSSTWCGPNDGQILTYNDCMAAVYNTIGEANWNGNAADQTFRKGCIIHHGKGYFVAGGGDQDANDGYYCENVNWHHQADHCGMVSTASAQSWVNTRQECEIAAMSAGYGTYQNNVIAVALGGVGHDLSDWRAGCIINGGTVYWVDYSTATSNDVNGNIADGGYLCKNPVVTPDTCSTAACSCAAACESSCYCNDIITTTSTGWPSG